MTTFDSALTLDIPRARKTLEHLIAHPEEHNQDNFGRATACGTTMCIAGTTVFQDSEAGGRLRWHEQGEWWAMVGPDDNYCEWIENKAIDLLGLTYADGQRLFFEWDNQAALDKLSSWIDAAEKAQAEVS